MTFHANSEHLQKAMGAQILPQPESQPESASLERRVLELLSVNNSLSKGALSAALRQKKVSGHLNQLIRTLLIEQRVIYTIPDKPQSRFQQYRLTEKGLSSLTMLRQRGKHE